MDLGLAAILLAWAFSGGGGRDLTPRAGRPHRPRRPRAPSGAPALPPAGVPSAPTPPAGTSPPWPQVVPAGLPAFPGSGWEPDEPPPVVVQTRAGQLLPQLWSNGAGTFKIEQTAGRWIAYRATQMGSKKGVVAYRLKPGAAAKPAPPASTAATPAVVPTVTTPPIVPPSTPPVVLDPIVIPVPGGTITPKSPLDLPTLRYGIGLKPQAPDDAVRLLQTRLSILSDGRFGSDTRAAVKKFQTSRGLLPDGVVGPKTWAALFSVAT